MFIASILLACFLLLIAARFLGVSLASLFQHRTTTTITATTQSISMHFAEGRDSSWSLPPGKFSIIGVAESPTCDVKPIESVCTFDENTRLSLKGAANLSMQISSSGEWLISISNAGSTEFEVEVFNKNSELILQSNQFLDYRVAPTAAEIRLPIVADSVVVGTDLHESATIDGNDDDFWQPVLLAGDVLIVASNSPGREKYEVVSERLDPGDVVHIGAASGEDTSAEAVSIWGMITITSFGASSSESGNSAQRNINAVLHTTVRELSVTRFGAPEGHVVKAPRWTILAKWPNGQAAWILFVSLALLFSFIFEITSVLDRSYGKR